MASIIIDGYNVTGIMHGDLEAERQRLVNYLAENNRLKSHNITVVFDGYRDGLGHGGRHVTGGITVVFSPLGEKADAVIKKTVAGGERHWIVVSSDREIQDFAWAKGSTPIGSEDFLRTLGRPREDGHTGDGDEHGDEDEDEDYRRPPKKGNPRKPSRRQVAVKRALSKL
jgi:predicted RNA-binding protein with PIN domain